jgi:hypothetical protein
MVTEVQGEKTYKICEMCKENKELNCNFFHKQKNGYKPKCKDCVNAIRRERYKNDPRARENKMKYQNVYQPLYYQLNKEKFREYARKHYEKKRIKKITKTNKGGTEQNDGLVGVEISN